MRKRWQWNGLFPWSQVRICKVRTEQLCFAVHQRVKTQERALLLSQLPACFFHNQQVQTFPELSQGHSYEQIPFGLTAWHQFTDTAVNPQLLFLVTSSHKNPRTHVSQHLSGLLCSAVFRDWFPLFQLSPNIHWIETSFCRTGFEQVPVCLGQKRPTPSIQKLPYGSLHNSKIIKYCIMVVNISSSHLGSAYFCFLLFTCGGSREKR